MQDTQPYLNRQSREIETGAKVAVYVTPETVPGTYEKPAATDKILVTQRPNLNQTPVLVESQAMDDVNRDPLAQIEGPLDHAEAPLAFELRPPNQLTGSDKPMGWTAIEMVAGGSGVAVNTQTAIDIASVVSHSVTATVVNLDINTPQNGGPIALGYVLAHRRKGDVGGIGDGLAYQVTKIVSAGGSGAGGCNVTFEPGFRVYPVVTGTHDQVQGGNCIIPDADWRTRYSVTTKDGDEGTFASGCAGHSLDLAFDRRNVAMATVSIGARKVLKAGADQIQDDGAGGVSFTNSDKTLKSLSPRKQMVGTYVKLVKKSVSTGLIVGTEGATTPLLIDAIENSTGIITFHNRGDNPVAATALRIVTSTQEVAETYDLSTKKYFYLNLDKRGEVLIDATSPTAPAIPAAATAAEVVANINAQLLASPLYGLYRDSPLGVSVSWASAASAVATKVRLTSQIAGSQSRITVRAYETSSTSAHDVIFTGAFDIAATDEVAIVPWTPGGTVTYAPVHGKAGTVRWLGAEYRGQAISVKVDNAQTWLEDVLTGPDDPYAAGVIPGQRMVLTAAMPIDAFPWTLQMAQMANDGVTGAAVWQHNPKVVGGSWGVAFTKARLSKPDRSGTGNRIQRSPEFRAETRVSDDDGSGSSGVIPAVVIFHC